MKNIFTLFLAFISLSAFAYDGGKLTITLPSSKNVQVYIDGRFYGNNNNSIVLDNVQPGNHSVAIYKNSRNESANNGNYGRNQRDRKKNVGDVVYSSNIYIRPNYHVDIMINRFGKALVDERAITNYRNNDDDWYEDNQGNDGYNNGGYNSSYHQAMSDYDFNQLLQKIRNQWIGKLSTVKDAMNGNYFSTGQVKQMLQVFSSENDRLDLAKLSYRNLVDRQNFRQLYDLFSYQSQSELDGYVRDFRY